MEVYQEVLKTQQPQSFVSEYHLRGKKYFFEISAYPSPNGLSVFVRDITERKQAEEALRESEAEKKAILDAMSDIVLFLDINLSIRWGNQAAERSAGNTQQSDSSFR